MPSQYLRYELWKTSHRDRGQETHLAVRNSRFAICGVPLFCTEEEMHEYGYRKQPSQHGYLLTCKDCKAIVKTCAAYTEGSTY